MAERRLKLSIHQIKFDTGSVVDDAGVVFHYDQRVFRAIRQPYADFYRDLLETKKLDAVFAAGLVKTWITNYELDGFGLIVEHEKVNELSHWSEWTVNMIKECALTVARVSLECAKVSCCLKDTQAGNIQFQNGKALWIDFGSIIPISNGVSFRVGEFRMNHLIPLWLISHKLTKLGLMTFQEFMKGPLKSFFDRQHMKWFPLYYARLFYKARNPKHTVKKLAKLVKYIENMTPQVSHGYWSDYGKSTDFNNLESFDKKQKSIYDILIKIKGKRVLDIAGNKGWYSQLAVNLGYRAICTDMDHRAVDLLFQRCKEYELPILPILLDFMYPAPKFGIALGKGDSFDRLNSDVVLVLALIHHLVFKRNLKFETIVSLIDRYSSKHAIIEFIPKEDQYVNHWYTNKFDWYNLENFVEALKVSFDKIEIFDSHPSPRILILCSKK